MKLDLEPMVSTETSDIDKLFQDKIRSGKINSRKKAIKICLCVFLMITAITVFFTVLMPKISLMIHMKPQHDTVAAYRDVIAAVKNDGTVYSTVYQDETSNWTNVIDIAVSEDFILALTESGEVLLAGNNSEKSIDVSNWQDIVDITAGSNFVVGIDSKGKAYASGENNAEQLEVDSWENIVAVEAGLDYTLGLKMDGTVVAQGNKSFDSGKYATCNVQDWSDVIYVSAGAGLSFGVKLDGTIYFTGGNPEYHGPWNAEHSEIDVSDFVNVKEISAGRHHFFALKNDGRVLAHGRNFWGECELDEWHNINKVISGEYYVLGLKNDGTLQIKQELNSSYSRESDLIDKSIINDWSNIRLS